MASLYDRFKAWLSALVKPSLLNFKYLALKAVKGFFLASVAFAFTAIVTDQQAFSWSLVVDVVMAGVAGFLHALSHVNSPKAKKVK